MTARGFPRFKATARVVAVVLAVVVVLILLVAWAVPLPERLGEPPSTVVTFADGSPAHVFLSPDDKYRIAVDPEAVDPDYLRALLRFEDKRFYRHGGVDPLAVMRALVLNLRSGRVVSGASTISMQLVRVLEPRPRTLRSKAIEALRAAQLELRRSKREILAAYLTFVPYGRNLEGIEAASLAYFGHTARDLAPEEIATLLAVPQHPARRYPSPRNAGHLAAARDEIAAWLLEREALAEDAVLAQIAESEVPRGFRPMPRHAPHAAQWLGRLHPQRTEIPTTLDRGIQLLTEKVMRGARARMAELGIHNGAVVIVDHDRGEVRALVGNFDFWDDVHGGQIVGFDVPRSPGSALKPFIYAMAIERGLALPERLVADVPASYGGYAPDNYDGRFAGLVTLESALSQSLNVPFVNLLAEVGVERFVATLRESGAASLRSEPGYYGLSAAIGGIETTPLELADLYATLANDGRFRPLRWLRDQTVTEGGVAMISPGAAYLTRRALRRRDRPDFPSRRRFSGAPARVHWKTGTSYGHRDAWAAGSGPRTTAVVWLGNFDNRPSYDLVGADAAGPLLFDLLEAVADRAAAPLPEPRPRDLKAVEVCAWSGHLPTAACRERKRVLALRRNVPTAPCPYHVAVDVDLGTGLALNPSCRDGRTWERRTFVVWPTGIRRWLAQHHRWLPSPPSPAPGCEAAGRRRPPSILSPPAGQVLVLLPGVPVADQEVPLSADAA
ncbi:MAG: penicillin-binding protein 1C, partial [bacterium]|nr:penicillin-binding protein 1C [bacterium]